MMGHDFINGRTGIGVVWNLGIHDAFKLLKGTGNSRNTILFLQRLPKSSRVLFTMSQKVCTRLLLIMIHF